MKKAFTRFATLILAFFILTPTMAQEVFIPDANFRSYLQSNYPTCMDGNNLITNAPGLANATSIIVANSNITDLTGVQYFTALTYLNCNNNQLTSIPSLAATSLTMMSCDHNQLVTVPALPTTITNFSCSNNAITELGTLPPNLHYLNADSCQLTSLSTLPSGLIYIDCIHNHLTSLPTLPNTLCDLIATGNSITCIPNYPTGCTLSSDIGTTICTATAISDPSSSEALEVYPNPFEQTLQVNLSNVYGDQATLTLYNMNGTALEIHQAIADETVEMGTSLSTGLYLLEIAGSNGTAKIKVVKK